MKGRLNNNSAIFTVVKAGFVVSARAGSGIVIARLDNGGWSAPSGIGTAGMGFGGQLGGEITEFIIVLNSKAAVKSFMAAGSLTIGGNMSVAVGPLGRNAEGTGALSSKGKMAAMYSYSRTKGLFGGVSIEGSVIVERQDANAKAYGADVTAKQLLSGQVDVPEWAEGLIATISGGAGVSFESSDWVDDFPDSPGWNNTEHKEKENGRSRGYSFGSPKAAISSDSNGQSQPQARPSMASRFSIPGRMSRSNSNQTPLPPSEQGFSTFDDHFEAPPNTDSEHESDDTGDHGTWAADAMRPATNWRRNNPAAFNQEPPPKATRSRSSTLLASIRSASPRLSPKIKTVESNPFENSEDRFQKALDFDEKPRHSLDSDSDHDFRKSSEFVFNGEVVKQEKAFVPSSARTSRSNTLTKPPALPKRPGEGSVVALYDFESQQPGDLPFNAGDTIQIVRKPPNSEWWVGRLDGKEGLFPSNYCQ